MEKICLDKDSLGFIAASDDTEESYLARTIHAETFYRHIKELADGKSRDLLLYFDGEIGGINLVEEKDAYEIINDYFAYKPKKFPMVRFDPQKAMPRRFSSQTESNSRKMAEIELAAAFMSLVPYEGRWHDIIYLPDKLWKSRARDYTMAHELMHACRTPCFLKKDDFNASRNPLEPVCFFEAEVYSFIVEISGHVLESVSEGRMPDKGQRIKLRKAIAGNASGAELENIIGANLHCRGYPLEDACKSLPPAINISYNSGNMFRWLGGLGGMGLGAATLNPFIWWFGAMNSMAGGAELVRAWQSMAGSMENYFEAGRKLAKAYPGKGANVILGRAGLDEVKQISLCSDVSEFVKSRQGFKWELIRAAGKI